MVGMCAKILDNAAVSSHTLTAAGGLKEKKFVVPDGTLAAGVSRRVTRDLKSEDIGKNKAKWERLPVLY